jgi:1,4-alpha-glucan branching enzyme
MAPQRTAGRRPTARKTTARKKRVAFTLAAPQAQSVLVTGSFCDWQTQSHPLKKDRQGTWKTTVPLPPGRYEYRFLVDGNWHDDPQCLERVPNPYGSENCVLHVLREVAQAERTKVACEEMP